MSIDAHTESMKRCAAGVAARRFKRSRQAAVPPSDLDLLRDLQGIVELDAEATDARLKLGMAQQELNGPQVLGPL